MNAMLKARENLIFGWRNLLRMGDGNVRLTFMALILATTITTAAYAGDANFSRQVKLSKGKAKVEFTSLSAESSPTGPAQHPRLGIAPSLNPSFANFLAKHMDDSARVEVIPPSKFSSNSAFASGFEQMLRSELESAVISNCRTAKLDYLLLFGSPQQSQKTDVTAFVFGLGRMRMRSTIETRLYDCRTRKSVWVQKVQFETSQGMAGMAFGGTGAGFGGPEAEQAMAGIFAEKLTADLKW